LPAPLTRVTLLERMPFLLSRPGRTPAWAHRLLIAAAAYIVAVELYEAAQGWAVRDTLAGLSPARYGTRLFVRPFVVAGSALLLWWHYFREERAGARPFALAAAAYLAMSWIVMVATSSLYGLDYLRIYTWGYPLCALACLVYVVVGRERTL
jgi:hypothetical protein